MSKDVTFYDQDPGCGSDRNCYDSLSFRIRIRLWYAVMDRQEARISVRVRLMVPAML